MSAKIELLNISHCALPDGAALSQAHRAAIYDFESVTKLSYDNFKIRGIICDILNKTGNVYNYMKNHYKIEAIKQIRYDANIGLKEAKDFVEYFNPWVQTQINKENRERINAEKNPPTLGEILENALRKNDTKPFKVFNNGNVLAAFSTLEEARSWVSNLKIYQEH